MGLAQWLFITLLCALVFLPDADKCTGSGLILEHQQQKMILKG